MRWLTLLLLAFFLGGGVLAGGLFVAHRQVVLTPVLFGTWLEDRLVPSDVELRAWLIEQRERLRQRPCHVEVDGELHAATFDALGIFLDAERTLEHIEKDRERQGIVEVFEQWFTARRAGLFYSGLYGFDAERARSYLASLAKQVRIEPSDAKLDLRGHRRVEHRPGRRLDTKATLAAIATGARREGSIFKAKTNVIQPAVTTDMLTDIDVSRVLSAYETDFANKAGARAVNIKVAAEYLNGTIIAPGGVLSFNKVVGERTAQRGFIEAPVIVNDEMEKDYGGGVCQVATTLHAAAVYGLMDIVRRRSHSRPSGYAPLGLDATVIDGKVDLRIKNPYDTPIMVHAFLPTRTRIRVELLGREPTAKVKHSYAVVETEDFARRVNTHPEAPPNEPKLRQKGNRGYKIVSTVTARHANGKITVRRYKSRYYPVPEVYWISTEDQLWQLPALPEGATHTLVNGVPRDPDSSIFGTEDGDPADFPEGEFGLTRIPSG